MKALAERVLLTTWRACVESVDDRIHRDAAQIGFFAMLSFVPLALLLVAAFGLVADDADVRARVVRTVFDNVPLSKQEDRLSLERTVEGALAGAGHLSAVSLVVLVVSASGIMGALRHAINQAWDIHERPPLLRRKALDVTLLLGATLLLLLSLSVTATRRAAAAVDDEAGAAAWLLGAFGDVLPFLFTGVVILFLYCVMPTHRERPRDVWPGVVVAVLLLALLREGLELYFEHLANLGALYGSLGALIALLAFVYAASIVLLFGAEFASEWTRLPGGREVSQQVSGLLRRARALPGRGPRSAGRRARGPRGRSGAGRSGR